MSDALEADVRAMIGEHCGAGRVALGLDPLVLRDDLDLRGAGLIDSLGFLELVGALEDRLAVELDFEQIDPQQLTVVGPLAAHVAAQVRRARRAVATGPAR